jgi:glycosyltransferase involved in cell wall biosynthesis
MAAAARETGASVRYEGWVGAERRAALFGEVDALAVPSLWPEPFGLVGVEAAYRGVPAIAFASGGITEWLEPGVTGEVAPGERPTAEGFALAIVRALEDPERLARLGRNAWEHSKRFSLEGHLESIERAFAEAIALRRRGP